MDDDTHRRCVSSATTLSSDHIADTAAMGRTRIMLSAAEVAARAPGHMEVIGGLLKDECDHLYT